MFLTGCLVSLILNPGTSPLPLCVFMTTEDHITEQQHLAIVFLTPARTDDAMRARCAFNDSVPVLPTSVGVFPGYGADAKVRRVSELQALTAHKRSASVFKS